LLKGKPQPLYFLFELSKFSTGHNNNKKLIFIIIIHIMACGNCGKLFLTRRNGFFLGVEPVENLWKNLWKTCGKLYPVENPPGYKQVFHRALWKTWN
jgi:hypothetical protein